LQNGDGQKLCFIRHGGFSIWLHIGQDEINLAMCQSSTFIIKFSFNSGQTVGQFPNTQSPELYIPYFVDHPKRSI
jgi:hypothetical protein